MNLRPDKSELFRLRHSRRCIKRLFAALDRAIASIEAARAARDELLGKPHNKRGHRE